MSPMEYIEGLKITLACELIKNKRLNLNQVAENTGFASYMWFNKVFKRIVKMTPSDYQRLCESGKLSDLTEGTLKNVDKVLENYHEFFSKNILL